MYEGRVPTDTAWDLVARRAELSGDAPLVTFAPGVALDLAALEGHCRAVLARFKVPGEFRVVEGLPKTSIGKVEKKTLRALLDG